MLKLGTGTLLACALLSLAACDGGSVFSSGAAGSSGGSGTLVGQVRTVNGPLSGVRVVLVNRDSTLTDATGSAVFRNLPASSYTVTVRIPTGFALAAGDSTQRTVQVSSTSGVVSVLFTLQTTGIDGTF
jgi:hypothetical protein